jgi:hypothetical protein
MALDDDPFAWRATGNGQILISRGGRLVTTVRGEAAVSLLARLEQADDATAQQLLARATGNYRRGNERR